ncbi:uncharacterized protein N7483_009530 [Penicillium malachiteum]|uniref:uncharacterized protein n=1 Tax=Penicillium malachiteum TaxID=1324776 RepID=UPI00254801FD|nr:uncharacterized protein N7483_009530 [Penicillium malachiteum]KAJ5721596.1 hypothetical protein N7483_009530 [Penicillium malachiteum]
MVLLGVGPWVPESPSSLTFLLVSFLLLGEESDTVLGSPDGKSCNCKEQEEHNDDNSNSDVALHHLVDLDPGGSWWIIVEVWSFV